MVHPLASVTLPSKLRGTGTERLETRPEMNLGGHMKIRTVPSYLVTFVLLAITASFALGEPPPKQPPEPGVVASQAW
jgi:hypothetical protein